MPFNLAIFNFINTGLSNPVFDIFFYIVTNLGAVYVWTIVIILLMAIAKKSRKVGIYSLITLILIESLSMVLKLVFDVLRPYQTPGVMESMFLLVDPVKSASFPSGHTMLAFSLAMVIGLNYNIEIKNKKISLAIPMLIFAVLIGFSRVYVGAHFPFDVLIGALIGLLIGGVVYYISRKDIKLNTDKIKKIIEYKE